jgi:hypothetical protein
VNEPTVRRNTLIPLTSLGMTLHWAQSEVYVCEMTK